MATDTLQTDSTPATTKLAEELGALEDRVRRMETLLRGAESILSTIRYDSDLCYTPASGESVKGHRRALEMIEFLGEQITQWRADEAELDFAADGIGKLVEYAENGALVRHAKPISKAA